MRLDHLLSKEFIIFCVEHALFLGGCTPPPSGGGVAADGKAWKEEFGVSHCLEKRCVGALLGVWNSTFRFVCGVLFLAPCGVAGRECGW